jgi:hypothetical protein
LDAEKDWALPEFDSRSASTRCHLDRSSPPWRCARSWRAASAAHILRGHLSGVQALADESAFIAQLRKTAARNLTVTLGRKAASDAERNGLLFNRSQSTANEMATALHLAAARSYASGCDALLRKIRDTEHEDRVLSAQDTFGRTPLENAFQLAEVPVVVLLLARYQERKLGAVLARVRPCSWDGASVRTSDLHARRCR